MCHVKACSTNCQSAKKAEQQTESQWASPGIQNGQARAHNRRAFRKEAWILMAYASQGKQTCTREPREGAAHQELFCAQALTCTLVSTYALTVLATCTDDMWAEATQIIECMRPELPIKSIYDKNLLFYRQAGLFKAIRSLISDPLHPLHPQKGEHIEVSNEYLNHAHVDYD